MAVIGKSLDELLGVAPTTDMDMQQFQYDSTDEGSDVSEGEIAYRIDYEGRQWYLVQYLASDPTNAEVVESCDSREEAGRFLREYLRQ